MGGSNFRNNLPINVPKYDGGNFHVFWRETFKFYDNVQSRTCSLHFHHKYCRSQKYAHSREKQPKLNLNNSQCFSQNAKVVFMLANYTSRLAFCSTDLVHVFGINVESECGVLIIRKCPYGPQIDYALVRIHSLMIFSNLVEWNIVGDTNAPLIRCFPFVSKLKGGDIITTGQ